MSLRRSYAGSRPSITAAIGALTPFQIRYHISHVHRLLRILNFRAQKPARRAREPNDAAVAEFRDEGWPEIKKARDEGRAIALVDESGFMLQPVVRRTWAPRGETPVHRSWDRHDRLSVISAITVSPRNGGSAFSSRSTTTTFTPRSGALHQATPASARR